MKLTRSQLPLPLFLCVLCQALYASFSRPQIACTAREMLFGGLYAALAICALLFGLLLLGQAFFTERESVAWRNVVYAFVCFLLLCGLIQAVLQQLQLYYRQFGSGGIWVVVFALFAVCLGATPHALLRSARLLLLLCILAALLCVMGLAGQSDLQQLSTAALGSTGISVGFWAGFSLYPEYLALLVCAPATQNVPQAAMRNKAQSSAQVLSQATGQDVFCTVSLRNVAPLLALPFFAVVVQAGMVFASELVFGVQQSGVAGFEVLRSWAFLSFSRFDGVIVLLWLLLSYLRLRFLAFIAWQISPLSQKKEGGKAGMNG